MKILFHVNFITINFSLFSQLLFRGMECEATKEFKNINFKNFPQSFYTEFLDDNQNYVKSGASDLELEELFHTRNVIHLFPNIFSYYLPKISPNVSKQCVRDLVAIGRAFENPETLRNENRWALKLVDSWGKFEDGILQGNRKFLGCFEECLSVKINGNANDTGRYCLMSYGLPSSTEKMRTPPLSSSLLGLPVASYYATCIPSTCTSEELVESVRSAIAEDGLELRDAQCQSSLDDAIFDASDIFGIVFFCCFAFVMLFASTVDVLLTWFQKDSLKEGTAVSFLMAFSIPKNLFKIFHLETNPKRNVISCLHGIRFLSITWVILGHQYLYSVYASSNPFYGPRKATSKFAFQIIANGDKSVDTFLLLSGLLVSFNFFRVTNNSRSFPLFKYYIHRIVRLVPPIAMTVAFFATLARFTVDGPFAVRYKDERTDSCRQFWWLDWTFFSNWVYRFGTELEKKTGEVFGCVPQCWYVSVDTQLYIVLPLILLPLLHWRKKGFLLFGFWTLVSFIVPASIIGVTGTYPASMISFNIEKSLQYTYLVYLMPYCRASPYLIGIWSGYLIWRNSEKKITLRPYQVASGWFVATVVSLFVLFGLYPYNEVALSNPADDISLPYSVFYGGFHRGLWGACVAWVILACHCGYGGMVNKFLSYPAFQPLSRLTYCIYLVSLPVQYILIYSTMRTTYYDHTTKIVETCGVLFFCGIGGLLLSLASEAPLLNIEKVITRLQSKTRMEDHEST